MVGKFVKRWAVLAIAVPLAAAGARKLSHTMEARRGRSRTSVLLGRGADTLQRLRGRQTRRRRLGW